MVLCINCHVQVLVASRGSRIFAAKGRVADHVRDDIITFPSQSMTVAQRLPASAVRARHQGSSSAAACGGAVVTAAAAAAAVAAASGVTTTTTARTATRLRRSLGYCAAPTPSRRSPQNKFRVQGMGGMACRASLQPASAPIMPRSCSARCPDVGSMPDSIVATNAFKHALRGRRPYIRSGWQRSAEEQNDPIVCFEALSQAPVWHRCHGQCSGRCFVWCYT